MTTKNKLFVPTPGFGAEIATNPEIPNSAKIPESIEAEKAYTQITAKHLKIGQEGISGAAIPLFSARNCHNPDKIQQIISRATNGVRQGFKLAYEREPLSHTHELFTTIGPASDNCYSHIPPDLQTGIDKQKRMIQALFSNKEWLKVHSNNDKINITVETNPTVLDIIALGEAVQSLTKEIRDRLKITTAFVTDASGKTFDGQKISEAVKQIRTNFDKTIIDKFGMVCGPLTSIPAAIKEFSLIPDEAGAIYSNWSNFYQPSLETTTEVQNINQEDAIQVIRHTLYLLDRYNIELHNLGGCCGSTPESQALFAKEIAANNHQINPPNILTKGHQTYNESKLKYSE